jgi:hypothetical protein
MVSGSTQVLRTRKLAVAFYRLPVASCQLPVAGKEPQSREHQLDICHLAFAIAFLPK